MLDKLKQIFGLKKEEETQPSVEERIEEAFNTLGDDIIKLEVGGDFSEFGNQIIEEIGKVREEITSDTGFILPPVHLLENDELQENEFIIYVRRKQVWQEFVIPNEECAIKGVHEALKQVFEENIDELFSMEYIEKYINKVQSVNSWLVWSITKQFGTTEIKAVLVDLIKNKKSIADINYIFEKIDACLASNRDCYHVWKPDVVARRICKEI